MKRRIIKMKSFFGGTVTFIEDPNLTIKLGPGALKKLEEANERLRKMKKLPWESDLQPGKV